MVGQASAIAAVRDGGAGFSLRRALARLHRGGIFMTTRIFAAVAIFAASAGAAEIPKGAHALLKMVNSVSSRTAKEGDQVYLQTAVPIAANDQILVPAGSYVQGVVTHTKRSGRVAGRAELAIRIETLTFPGGKTI